MQAIDRWRNWKPTGEKFGGSLHSELTKPTKPTSVSFVGSSPGKAKKSSPDEPAAGLMAQVELLPSEIQAWNDAMRAWTQARCALRERSWGSVSSLYVDHVAHAHQTGGMFAPDRETFQAILMALGFAIEDGMVYGLLLREDEEAAHWRPKPPSLKRNSARIISRTLRK